MSGIETNNQSQQFKGGKVTAIMGGIDIDLEGGLDFIIMRPY